MGHHGSARWLVRGRAAVATLAIGTLLLTACGGDDASMEGDEAEDASAAADDEAEDASAAADDEAEDASAAADEETPADGMIAVLLPSGAAADRWEVEDPKWFRAAFEEAGLTEDQYMIFNAQDDSATTQQVQAEQALTNGATVLLLTNLDSGSGAAIIETAKQEGVAVIDYDRLTLEADSDYYVSFDNVAVGRLMGEGLVSCLQEEGVEEPRVALLNGGPDDNNAHLFKEGYDSVLDPNFADEGWIKVDDQFTPGWDNQEGLIIFEQMLTAADDEIDGAIAANDGLANAVVSALKSQNLDPIPVTGQDATTTGMQNILSGWQCMSVYKSIKAEAEAAAELAIALMRGEQPEVDDAVNNGERDVPSVLLTPASVTADNMADTVIADGFRTWDEICVGEFEQYCPEDR